MRVSRTSRSRNCKFHRIFYYFLIKEIENNCLIGFCGWISIFLTRNVHSHFDLPVRPDWYFLLSLRNLLRTNYTITDYVFSIRAGLRSLWIPRRINSTHIVRYTKLIFLHFRQYVTKFKGKRFKGNLVRKMQKICFSTNITIWFSQLSDNHKKIQFSRC